MTLTSNVTGQQIVNAINAGKTPCLKWTDGGGTCYFYLTECSFTASSGWFRFGSNNDIEITFSSLSNTLNYSDGHDGGGSDPTIG